MAEERSAEEAATERVVVVDGDVTIDWHLARRRAQPSARSIWSAKDGVRTYRQPGGAALLGELIEAALSLAFTDDRPAVTVWRARQEVDTLRPDDARFNHSFATWAAFPYAPNERPQTPAEAPSWRVEAFLGIDKSPLPRVQQAVLPLAPAELKDAPAPSLPPASVVVLDDAGLGYREAGGRWRTLLGDADSRQPWVLLKMAHPVAAGDLWAQFVPARAAHLVVVMAVSDLRLSEVRVSRELSWERAAQDLAWELVHNLGVQRLAECAAVVVSFGPVGAFLLCGRAGVPGASVSFKLFFDPDLIESAWEADHPGGMIGYTVCLTAALAQHLALRPEPAPLDFDLAIRNGLAAMRTLHLEGYGERGTEAEAAHVVWAADELAKADAGGRPSYAWNEPTDDYLHRHAELQPYVGRARTTPAGAPAPTRPNLLAFENLSERVKDSNRSFVRDVERKLALTNYVMLPARSHEPPFNFPGDDLERLAEDEHERWMAEQLDNRAQWGTVRDDTNLVFPSLQPWRRMSRADLEARYGADRARRIGGGPLTDEDKDRDRNLIRNIPRILAVAGYTMVKLPSGDTST